MEFLVPLVPTNLSFKDEARCLLEIGVSRKKDSILKSALKKSKAQWVVGLYVACQIRERAAKRIR